MIINRELTNSNCLIKTTCPTPYMLICSWASLLKSRAKALKLQDALSNLLQRFCYGYIFQILEI